MERVERRPSIFRYADPQSFLLDTYSFKRERNRAFSTRTWARKMGFSSHASLSLLINGKRVIKTKHVPRLLAGLDLNEREAKYLDSLVRLRNSKSPAEAEVYEAHLKSLHPDRDYNVVDLEKFAIISDWIHMAILEMTELKGFLADSAWIAERLGDKVTPAQVSDAVRRLLLFKLLKESGGTLIKTYRQLTTPKDRANHAVRSYHRQVMELASAALDEQDPSVREFSACAIPIDLSKLAEAKALVAEFREKLGQLAGAKPADSVYQLNLQFFRLSRGESL